MKAQKVYGRKASRQYNEVRTKYVPDMAFSKILSQSLKRGASSTQPRCLGAGNLILNEPPSAPQVTVGKLTPTTVRCRDGIPRR
jgi:hypothetical protein